MINIKKYLIATIIDLPIFLILNAYWIRDDLSLILANMLIFTFICEVYDGCTYEK